MTDDEIRRVRAAFAAPGDADAFSRRFCTRLFLLRPDLRHLFPPDLEAAAGGLARLLASIMRDLDAPGRLARACAAFGRRHAARGLREDDYDDVGAALLVALRGYPGAALAPAAEQAWGAVYGELAESLIAASRTAGRASKPCSKREVSCSGKPMTEE